MTVYLLDSGFFYASIDKTDKHHKSVNRSIQEIRGTVILPIPAITETAYFLSRNQGIESVARFCDSVATSKFHLETPTAEDYIRSAEILRKYNDANIDFVDA